MQCAILDNDQQHTHLASRSTQQKSAGNSAKRCRNLSQTAATSALGCTPDETRPPHRAITGSEEARPSVSGYGVGANGEGSSWVGSEVIGGRFVRRVASVEDPSSVG